MKRPPLQSETIPPVCQCGHTLRVPTVNKSHYEQRIEFLEEQLRTKDQQLSMLIKRLPKGTEITPKISRKQKHINDKTLLISTLLYHHKFDTATSEHEGLNYEPAKQEAIGKQLKWPQSKVSRVLKKSFPEGFWKMYNEVCKTDAIKGFLKNMDDNQVDIEAIA